MLIYKFDGSLNGLLCCVFKSFTNKETPDLISSDKNTQLSLTDREINVITVDSECERIEKAIEKYSGLGGLYDIRYAFKSGAKNKNKIIFDFLKKTFESRRDISGNFSESAVLAFYDLIKDVSNEVHRMKGFVRFIQTEEGIYYAHIKPDNDIVALLMPHFSERFKNMQFAIHDEKRNIIGLYNGCERKVIKLNTPLVVKSGKNEDRFKFLWSTYYESVNIKERENRKLMRRFMPARYEINLFEKSFKNKECI